MSNIIEYGSIDTVFTIPNRIKDARMKFPFTKPYNAFWMISASFKCVLFLITSNLYEKNSHNIGRYEIFLAWTKGKQRKGQSQIIGRTQ